MTKMAVRAEQPPDKKSKEDGVMRTEFLDAGDVPPLVMIEEAVESRERKVENKAFTNCKENFKGIKRK